MARLAALTLIACTLAPVPAALAATEPATGGAAVPATPVEPEVSGGGAATPQAVNPPAPAPTPGAPAPAAAPAEQAAPAARAAQSPTTTTPGVDRGESNVAVPVEHADEQRAADAAAPAASGDGLPTAGFQVGLFAALGALALATGLALRRSAA